MMQCDVMKTELYIACECANNCGSRKGNSLTVATEIQPYTAPCIRFVSEIVYKRKMINSFIAQKCEERLIRRTCLTHTSKRQFVMIFLL